MEVTGNSSTILQYSMNLSKGPKYPYLHSLAVRPPKKFKKYDTRVCLKFANGYYTIIIDIRTSDFNYNPGSIAGFFYNDSY